jgi:hypothetical protein
MSTVAEGLCERALAAGASDVSATGAGAGRPLRVVAAGGEPYHRYALILVD